MIRIGTRQSATRLALALCISALAASCATSNPQTGPPSTESTQARYLSALRDANTVYTETMIEAGRLNAEGQLDDAQLARVRKAGKITENALRTAKSALEVWVVVGGDTASVDMSLARVQQALVGLLGVSQPVTASPTTGGTP